MNWKNLMVDISNNSGASPSLWWLYFKNIYEFSVFHSHDRTPRECPYLKFRCFRVWLFQNDRWDCFLTLAWWGLWLGFQLVSKSNWICLPNIDYVVTSQKGTMISILQKANIEIWGLDMIIYVSILMVLRQSGEIEK